MEDRRYWYVVCTYVLNPYIQSNQTNNQDVKCTYVRIMLDQLIGMTVRVNSGDEIMTFVQYLIIK